MRAGDPHPQHAGPDPEAKRRVERQGLTVDAGRDRAVGVDLELGGRPLAPRSLGQALLATAPARRRRPP